MPLTGTGIYDNRLRYGLMRALGVFGGCAFIAGGILALFDERGSWITVVFFVFFGLLIMAIPLVIRMQTSAPALRNIDGRYGILLHQRSTSMARLIVFSALAVIFYALALGGMLRMFAEAASADFGLALLIALNLGTLFAYGARATLRSMRANAVGVFLTQSEIQLRERRTPVTVAWDEIVEIYAHWTKSGLWLQPATNWLTFERKNPALPGSDADAHRDVHAVFSGTPEPTINLGLLVGNPHQITVALQYFLANPNARRALGTSSALKHFD